MEKPGTRYEEVLRPPLSWWLMAAGGVAAVWWCFVVATPASVAGIAALVAAVGTGTGLARYGSVRVSTDEHGLRAGRAVLPWQHVGSVEVLGPEQLHRTLGVDADARAHLLLRSYCRGAVKVAVDDARDPTPYWVISTRRGEELALHLERSRVQD